MTDIEEITAGLMETFRALKSGDMEAKDAQEINNTAGKVISAYKTRIAYHALRGEAPSIPGLTTTTGADAVFISGLTLAPEFDPPT